MKGLLSFGDQKVHPGENGPLGRCNKQQLPIKYEAGAGRPQVSGPAKTRLTPKYEGLLAKGALW